MKVRCINNEDCTSLTIGKCYDVVVRRGNIILIDCDNGRAWYQSYRFEVVEDEAIPDNTDNVNHPSHYNQCRVECIEVIEDVTKDLTGLDAVCTANALKYLWRWKHKNGMEDVKKAIWYLQRLVKTHENNAQ